MAYRIKVTHLPSSRFGSDEAQALDRPCLFGGFRARTGRDRFRYGDKPEVVLFDPYRHAKPASWASREAAERNLARLTERGYVAQILAEKGAT